MSNKFSFIDAKSYELSKVIVSRIPESEVIDEIIYDFKSPSELINDDQTNKSLNNNLDSKKPNSNENKIPNVDKDDNKFLPSPNQTNLVNNNDLPNKSKLNDVDNNALNKNIEQEKEMPMKDFNKYNFNNNLNDNSVNNKSEPLSAIDTFNDIDFNVMQDFDNIVNINDVYDDLGRAFQDDLSNQYSQLDKYTSQDDTPKYSYLPKRKIKDILLSKYDIDNNECVNELYSMAFNNKWREIDVEHWLLNPANLSALVNKYLPKKENQLKPAQTVEETSNQVEQPKPTTTVDNKIYVPVKQEKDDFDRHNRHHHPIHPMHHFNPYINPYGMMLNNQQNNTNIKDDMKAVLVEENYRKMQFDYQTEMIKNHIDHKINDVLNSQKNIELNNSNKDNSNNKNQPLNNLSDEELNEKITTIFDQKKDELVEEMNQLKSKFEENEKVVFDALDFIRKEIKENESNINSNLNETLKEMKHEIGSTLANYVKELNDKQNDFINIIQDKQTKIMDDISSKQNQLENQFNSSLELINSKQNSLVDELLDKVKTNDEDLKFVEVLSTEFNSKFKTISDELGLIKNNIDSNNKNNALGINDLQLELTNQLNNVSSEMKRSVTNLYDEIENINKTIDGMLNQKEDINFKNKNKDFKKNNNKNQNQKTKPNNQKVEEEIVEKPSVSLADYVKQVNTKNEIEDEFKNVPLIDTNNNTFDFQKDFKEPKYVIQTEPKIEEFKADDVEYDDSTLTSEDKDFYKSFLDSNSVDQTQNNLVSNFDANSKVNSIEIEEQPKPVEEENKKNDGGFDIKSRLSKIDEIIKNSIDELSDIKEYVDEDNAKIDDSIKLFEQVKQ